MRRKRELTEQLRVSERSYQQALDRQHFWNQSADDLAAALQLVRDAVEALRLDVCAEDYPLGAFKHIEALRTALGPVGDTQEAK